MHIVIESRFNNPELIGFCYNSLECCIDKENIYEVVERAMMSIVSLNAPDVTVDVMEAIKEKITFDNQFINDEYRILFVGRFSNDNLSVVIKELK